MQSTLPSIMLELKTSTQPLHDATEAHEFQKTLVGGRVPRDLYVELLAQLLIVHVELERHLRRLAEAYPAIAAVVREYQFSESNLRTDLEAFGRAVSSVRPQPATLRFVERIARTAAEHPLGLLGYHYVFEGSKNGGRYIARAVRAAYALPADAGTRYLDPYGDAQRKRWQAFKEEMDAVTFSPEERAGILRAAAEAFEAIGEIHQALHESASRPVVV